MGRLTGKFMALLKLRSLARGRNGAIAAGLLIFVALLAVVATTFARRADEPAEADVSTQSRRVGELYYPTAKQWASLTTAPVNELVFRTEHLTEGKIAVDEDRATLVYSPYAGRVIKLLAKPGDMVASGQPLFVVESPDMVQAQNDFISAVSGLNKARSQLDLAKIVEQQNKQLYETRAAPLRDVQQSQAAPRWRPKTICGPPKPRLKLCATDFGFSARPTRKSPPSAKPAPSIR